MGMMKFIRVRGRIIPLLKKSGVGKTVSAAKSSSKVSNKIAGVSKKLSDVNAKRAAIPGLKKQYAGTRYGDSLLDVEDARQVGRMRNLEKSADHLKSRKTKLTKLKNKAAVSAGMTGLQFAAVGSLGAGAASYFKKKRKTGV